MSLRIGALFAGYGGLDMAVMDTLDAELAWYAEFDKAPAKVMAHHHPDVPNLWDVTKVDWAAVEPVDIITGGSPCQDLSHAGKRKGMTDGTRSNLWAEMREAIAVHRPRLVVWENVRGAYSATADSDMEPCPRCVGGAHDRGPVLRALGRVLGDLAELGYDARWYGLRAADVGGAHGRFRIFVIAHPVSDAERGRLDGRAFDALGGSVGGVAAAGCGEVPGATLTLLPTPVSDNSRGLPSASTDYASLANVACALLPTPRASEMEENPETFAARQERMASAGRTKGDSGMPLNVAVTLLPTPAVNDMGEGKEVDAWDEWTAAQKAKHGNGNGHGKSLAIEAQRLTPDQGPGRDWSAPGPLLPTPTSSDHKASGSRGYGGNDFSTLTDATVRNPQDWRQYDAAIRRAEHATGRTAPAPTETGPKGKPRLSPAFVEWLMMLPAGHVTNPAIGLTRNEQLKALGNGVVPAQAAAALRAYIHDENEAAA